jgi:hypothetical protein
MGLAEQLIGKQLESEKPSVVKTEFFNYELPKNDELGIPTANSIEYLIARIFYVDYHFGNIEHLHLREDGRIWEGDHWVAENNKNMYRLLKWQGRPLSQDQVHMLWNRLRECIPTLSDDKIVVKDNLVYDKESGELYFSDETVLTIN